MIERSLAAAALASFGTPAPRLAGRVSSSAGFKFFLDKPVVWSDNS